MDRVLNYEVSYTVVGTTEVQEWKLDGVLHHHKGPARVVWDRRSGELEQEEWYRDGKLHGDRDMPAVVMYDEGDVVERHWYENGRRNRWGDDIAFERVCPVTETKTSQWWCVEDQLHRLGAPAMIERDADSGTVTIEAWFKDGNRHREDGPALIERDAETGNVSRTTYFINGREVTAPNGPEGEPSPGME